jgi:AcrR family transcriptional regulator
LVKKRRGVAAARTGHGRRGKQAKLKRDRPGEMMDLALNLFAERNFAAVTIKDIAAAQGVNTALIYYYFSSKEDLFRAAIERTVNTAFAHFRTLRVRHTNPADVLEDWLANHIDMFDPIHKLVKISLDYYGSAARQPSIDRSIQQFYEEEARILSDCVQEGMDLGIFEPVDARQVARFISGYLDGLMVRTVIQPGLDLRAAVAHFRDVLWKHLGYRPKVAAVVRQHVNRGIKPRLTVKLNSPMVRVGSGRGSGGRRGPEG